MSTNFAGVTEKTPFENNYTEQDSTKETANQETTTQTEPTVVIGLSLAQFLAACYVEAAKGMDYRRPEHAQMIRLGQQFIDGLRPKE